MSASWHLCACWCEEGATLTREYSRRTAERVPLKNALTTNQQAGSSTCASLRIAAFRAILGNPAWQAVNTELVPPDEQPAAVTLSSVSYNLARAVGPALAGLLVAAAGPTAVFLLNALAYLYVVGVLYRWHPAPHRAVLPAERLVGALRKGVRLVQNSPQMQTVSSAPSALSSS